MTPTPRTVDHLGFLDDIEQTPAYLLDSGGQVPSVGRPSYSCAFCGMGDGGRVDIESPTDPIAKGSASGVCLLRVSVGGRSFDCAGWLTDSDQLHVESDVALTGPGGTIVGQLENAGETVVVVATELQTQLLDGGASHVFRLSRPVVTTAKTSIGDKSPSAGCVKLRISLGQQPGVFPIHIEPSVLDRLEGGGRAVGGRRAVEHSEAIGRFADLLLSHRPPHGRTLFYACGQVDYFTVFAAQEVLRLLGVRNITGNAEHCLNAGAVHNEMLTGQEGPFLTIDDALNGPDRFYLLNGWNGLITHPPAFRQLLRRTDFDAYVVEVAATESAQAVTRRLGTDRVLFVRSGGDPHLALGVAHEILTQHPGAVDRRFVDSYAERASFDSYAAMASAESFDADRVAAHIAPEARERQNLAQGIRAIAARLADPHSVPINIPSVGLSQTKGAVAHCLWGSVLALVGKYGLRPDGTPAGGTLRLPGQINAQSEVQGLSRRIFMGRIPFDENGAAEAASRMGLPSDAYAAALGDTPRPALDYSDPAEVPELIVCFGTQFEANMMERTRWVTKLEDPANRLVVIDPIPDPFTLERADLVIPSPAHGAAPKLYQNGEWRFSLSIPRKQAATQTRSDATILYDVMAEVSRRLRQEPDLADLHPDLAGVSASGYLRERFEAPEDGGGLARIGGEVNRAALWERIIGYMSGGSGPLYCRPEHDDGRPIAWAELLAAGSVLSGGVGTTRYRLDYADSNHNPFADVYRRPRRFRFFVPTDADLVLPTGTILNSGRSTMSEDRARIRFATSTFNSGKATPVTDMPEDNPLHVSPAVAATKGLATGDMARVTNPETGESLVLPVVVTDRVKGDAAYVSFHKSRAELDRGRYINTLTGHSGRCPYTAQSNFKSTVVDIERQEREHS